MSDFIYSFQVEPMFSKPVDLTRQLEKITDLNSRYNAGLNIDHNLEQLQHSPIDAPANCEKILVDGNCFFRSISFLLCGDQRYHYHIRQALLLRMCLYSVVLSSLLPSKVSMSEYIAQSRLPKMGFGPHRLKL